jgi:hypothetical protein
MSNHYSPNYMRDFWCGDGERPSNYARNGSRFECFQRGFGAGHASGRCENMPPGDIRRMPYYTPDIGVTLRRDYNVRTCRQLFAYVEDMRSVTRTRNFIFSLFGENATPKQYNRFLDFLYNNGVHVRYIPRARNELT